MRWLVSGLFFFLLTHGTFGEEAMAVEADEARYRKDGLFLWVALADDPDAFLSEWQNPSKPNTPVIKTRTAFHRGDIVFPALMYSTDGLTADGNAMITYDILVKKPDGSVYEDMRDLVAVPGAPPKGVGLGRAMMGVKIEETDPLGPYTLNVKIRDQVKNVTVEMPFIFTVTEKESNRTSLLDRDGDADEERPRFRAGSAPTLEATGAGGSRGIRIQRP
jgi:hypothetical protein